MAGPQRAFTGNYHESKQIIDATVLRKRGRMPCCRHDNFRLRGRRGWWSIIGQYASDWWLNPELGDYHGPGA